MSTIPEPSSISEWMAFTQDSPDQAAAEFTRRVACLPENQRKAVFAHVLPHPELQAAFASATRCGGPLAGVPYALKDLFDLKGTPTRAGSSFFGDLTGPAKSNAHVVNMLSGRGAVCAAKTHLHEFAYGLTGENPFHGNLDNPAFPGRTTGGSSSGSAAAVAAGIVPFAIGTDTGGSIRIPATFCGLYGYRMAPGNTWISDAFALAPSCDSMGWFTANVADMKILLSLFAERESTHIGRPSHLPRGLYLPHDWIAPEIARACADKAALLCPAAGDHSRKTLEEAFAPAAKAYSILTSAEAAIIHAPWLDSHKASYSPAVWARIDRGRKWQETELIRAASDRAYIEGTLSSFFLGHDFLAMPTAPCPALRHEDCSTYDRERILRLTAPASLAGLPCLTLPLKDADGRPLAGLQIILSPSTAIRTAAWILTQEKAT